MILAKGTQLGHYEVIEAAGAGGMGEVYRGYDRRLGRAVAIKVLKADLLANEEARRRFHREAKAVAALSNPNIVAIYDIGSMGNVDFMVSSSWRGKRCANASRTRRCRCHKRSTSSFPCVTDLPPHMPKGLLTATSNRRTSSSPLMDG